jgi:hypothetical protein
MERDWGIMTTISSDGKIGYIYDESTTTWYPISGIANTSANYTWSGTHTFSNAVSFQDVLNARAGINNFQNATARDAAIPSPVGGATCFIRQDGAGVEINELQFYSTLATKWISIYDTSIKTNTSNYVLLLTDSGNTVRMNTGSSNTITVPLNTTTDFPVGTQINILQWGTGQTSIVEAAGVTVRSKNSNKKLAAQYAGASLIKVDINEWALVGDLTA